MKKVYVFILIVIMIDIVSLCMLLRPNLRDFSVLDGEYKKLMIVAHPDDEVMWGFSELMSDDYLVVCITCGSKYKRIKEFTKVIKYTNDSYIMLDYEDKIDGERSNWEDSYKYIKNDLERIIKYKDWEVIITHNPKGEYGHIHHIITNEIVTKLADKSKLKYFGKYYKRPKDLKSIDQNILDKKKYVINNIYKTQKNVLNNMSQMYPYENIMTYDEWNDKYE